MTDHPRAGWTWPTWTKVAAALAAVLGGGLGANALVLDTDPPPEQPPDCRVVGWRTLDPRCPCVDGISVPGPGRPATCPHPDHQAYQRPGETALDCECATPDR